MASLAALPTESQAPAIKITELLVAYRPYARFIAGTLGDPISRYTIGKPLLYDKDRFAAGIFSRCVL